MSLETIFLILVVISIAFFPCIAIYYRWKLGWDYKRKQRKIAEFIEKSADEQIKSKDGPE